LDNQFEIFTLAVRPLLEFVDCFRAGCNGCKWQAQNRFCRQQQIDAAEELELEAVEDVEDLRRRESEDRLFSCSI
jgi:hypothetical protein